MTVPKACQGIADQLEAASKTLARIQSSPHYIDHDGPRPGKPNPAMLREAEQEEATIRRLAAELNTCKREHGVDPDELSTFSGTASMSSPEGSGHHHFSATLEFLEPHHEHFLIQEFPPIELSVGGHSVTITQTGGGHGHFDRSSGELDLQVDLMVDAPSPGGHMDLSITLSTESQHGSRLNPHHEVALAGSGVGHGHGIGFPSRVDVTMVAKGSIVPPP